MWHNHPYWALPIKRAAFLILYCLMILILSTNPVVEVLYCNAWGLVIWIARLDVIMLIAADKVCNDCTGHQAITKSKCFDGLQPWKVSRYRLFKW